MPNPLTAILTTLSAAPNSGGHKPETDDTPAQSAFSDVLDEVSVIDAQDIEQTVSAVLPDAQEGASDEQSLDPPNVEFDADQAQIAPPTISADAPSGKASVHDGHPARPNPQNETGTVTAQAFNTLQPTPPSGSDPADPQPAARPEPIMADVKPQSPQIFEHAFRLQSALPAVAQDRLVRQTTRAIEPIEAQSVELAGKKSPPIETAKPVVPQALNPAGPALTPSVEIFEPRADTALSSEAELGLSVKETATTQGARDLSVAQMMNTARADIARAIAGQMAAAISAKPGSGAVEIALNPEELGRVSIILNGREDGFQLTIAAERPETLDLMRRHLAVLSSEFQKLGYSDLSFDLGMSNDTGQGGDDTAQDAPTTETLHLDEAELAAPSPRIGPDRGLDMRL